MDLVGGKNIIYKQIPYAVQSALSKNWDKCKNRLKWISSVCMSVLHHADFTKPFKQSNFNAWEKIGLSRITDFIKHDIMLHVDRPDLFFRYLKVGNFIQSKPIQINIARPLNSLESILLYLDRWSRLMEIIYTTGWDKTKSNWI